MENTLAIGNRRIGHNKAPFLIAEIGLNHNNDFELTKKMILAAKKAGAQAVKFQFYITENLMVESSGAFSIFKNLELTRDNFSRIMDFCNANDILCFATPFCKETADILEELDVPCYKIASSDLNYYDFISHIAEKGKPVILSTGMASLGEVEKAVHAITLVGNTNIVLLHCISKYPPDHKDMALSFITRLKNMYPQFTIGFSDHTGDNLMSVVARTLGAAVFERHFTLDKELEGPDHGISLNPDDFKDLADKLAAIDESVRYFYDGTRADKQIASGARRSLFAGQDLKKGTVLTPDMIKIIRPGSGIAPEFLPLFIGRPLTKDVKKDDQISLDCI